jgi:hypothetical protein
MEDPMNQSTLDAGALFSEIQENTTQAIDQNAAAGTLGQLITDVNGGDTVAAQKSLTLLTQQMSGGRTGELGLRLSNLLIQLYGELATGNISAAQVRVRAYVFSVNEITQRVASNRSQNQRIGLGSDVVEPVGGTTVGAGATGKTRGVLQTTSP